MPATGLDIRGQGPNAGNGILYADAISIGSGGVVAPRTVVNTSVTFDPPSLATVTGALSSGITVTGAALGDAVELFPPYDTQGVTAYGFVSAANTIKISLFNPTAGTIDLASGSWGVAVKRRV